MSALAGFAPRPRQVFAALGIAVIFVGIFIGIVYARTGIPSPSAIASAQTTTLYFNDGKTRLANIGTTNRIDVPLSAVPIDVQHAVLAAEDRHFYSEPGVSPTGILRALFVDLRGGDVTQGGSTITQQYAKNAYLSQQRSLTRKLKEIVIATKLGQTRSKSTVFDDYLNTIYFGRNAYGIQAAAKAYFGENVGQLTTAQGALLAAIIRGPSLYDPRADRAQAQTRFDYVVHGMLVEHWLTPEKAARLHLPHTKSLKNSGHANCLRTNCYIRDAVVHELLTKDGFSQAQLDQGGYKIVTTIDPKDEQALINAEHTILPTQNAQQESGAASVKPGDGAIEALYGGTKYCHNQKKDRDACVDLSGGTGQMSAPSGSSMKTFTLITALRQGISLLSRFDGPPVVDVDGSQIHNSSLGESCYGCTLLNAFTRSINTIFVPLAKQVGPEKVVQTAYDAGIPTARALSKFPDVTLGPDRISPLDLADAYATVAAQGMHATPYLVKSVTTTSGQRVFTAHPHPDRVFSPDVMADTTYAMTRVLQSGGTAAGHALTGRQSAGKTGTTDNNSNAWFTGFTPQLCTSVWIGNVSRTKTLQIVGGAGEVFGGTLPAEIWQDAMNAALAGVPAVPFPPPANVGVTEESASPTATATSTATKTATASPTATASTTTPSPTTSPSAPPSVPVTPTATAGSSPAGTRGP